MRVVALFSKPRASAPMMRVHALCGIGGHGLADDVHATAASPRHVLIAGADDIHTLGLRDDALRANILVARGVQDLTSGQTIVLGSLALRITMRCEPCHRLDDERPGLAKVVGARRGVLARVLDDGIVRDDDPVTCVGHGLPPLADDWHERVGQIVRAIPPAMLVTYAGLAEVAGVQRAYCRALPTVLRKAALAGAPVHRVVPADLAKIAEASARQLVAEGADLARPAYWQTSQFYEADERRLTRVDRRGADTRA